ncbi:uncharacterized protein LOC142504470 [Primulina tabacum]|uniref:uncharacterized protein LOC142504470 n=1 Tax=Primulina tabacum TaxID=48773 RepID=UPI003F59DF0E
MEHGIGTTEAVGRPWDRSRPLYRGLMVQMAVQAYCTGLNRIETETFVSRGNVIAEYGGKISDGTTAIQFENQRTSAVKETEGMTGSPSVKILCSRKILQEASEKKAWKRFERSTPESPPSNGEETVNFKDNRIAVDEVVIDYEQPHRKPPIHNWEP